MKKIYAERIGQGRSPKIEPFLIPESIPDAAGQEHRVEDLLQQCRRDYQSHSLLPDGKKKLYRRKKYSPTEIQWIAEHTIEEIQFRLGLNRDQAATLKWRCSGKIRLQQDDMVNSNTIEKELDHAQTERKTLHQDR